MRVTEHLVREKPPANQPDRAVFIVARSRKRISRVLPRSTAHIPVMTAPQITARQAVAAFDATRTEAARVAGHPVPRCAVPTALRRASVAPDGSTAVFFWLDRKTLLQAGRNQPAVAASATGIADAVTSPGAVAVAVNTAALRAVETTLARGATAATGEAAERVRHAARIVQYAGAAAMSSRVVVLTEALARKFYLAGDTGRYPGLAGGLRAGAQPVGAGRPAGRDVPGRQRPPVLEPVPGPVPGHADRGGDRRGGAEAQLHLERGHRVEGGREDRRGMGFRHPHRRAAAAPAPAGRIRGPGTAT